MPIVPSNESISRAAETLLATDYIDAMVDSAVIAYDLDALQMRFEQVQRAFPATTLHAVAIKANPLRVVMGLLRSLGCGFEAASLPELALARSIATPEDRIVFDSPAKTMGELRLAMTTGCHINIDSFQELTRVDTLIRDLGDRARASFGIRVNPQVGTGAIEATSVAGRYSKFGIPLSECEPELIAAYHQRPWLTGVHVHIGSQGCSVELLVRGCELVHGFVKRLNMQLATQGAGRRVTVFDLGGGLPVQYRPDQETASVVEYAQRLAERIPDLFSDSFRLVTEFGRHVHANAGWVMSQIEYVKPSRDIHTLILHIGADMFLRECYQPDHWHHEILVLDRKGQTKRGPTRLYNLAGPLCFAGDFVGRGVALPEVEPGDFVVLRDAGAYTLSMWSRYNSRQIPLVLGYRGEGADVTVIRRREDVADVIAFWSQDGRPLPK